MGASICRDAPIFISETLSEEIYENLIGRGAVEN